MSVAYLDPGAGSLIASALVGGAAAAGVAVKSARSKFAGAFSRKSRSGGKDGNGAAAETDGQTPDAAEPAMAESAEAGAEGEAPATSDA